MAYLSSENAILSIAFVLITVVVLRYNRHSHRTKLMGPSTKNLLFGFSKEILNMPDYSHLFEDWERQYGSVYHIPTLFGLKNIVLCDPKAITHHYAGDTFTYRQAPSTRFFFETFFGRNLLWAEAETHKRQRKALSSAFSNASIRNLTSVFYDSAYSLKASWDSSLQTHPSNSLVIDVQKWMNCISLDNIGQAGFSHNFRSLAGSNPPVLAALDSFGTIKPNTSTVLIMLLSEAFPPILKIPTERTEIIKKIRSSISSIAGDLLEDARAQKEAGMSTDRSIIGTLVRSESVDSASVHMIQDEIMAQIFLLIIAGYETIAISLTWALIDLCKHPEEQDKLRAELASFSAEDPTWEQLTNGLPYLDAVVCETLRLHPSIPLTLREAQADDIVPLSKPIHTIDGRLVDHIVISKGSFIYVPIMSINRSEALWGKDAKNFSPGRWLNDSNSQLKATEIQGYRHLLTFIEGPRTCLGKSFALTEFKVVLSVLIRNYIFELPDGPTTKFENYRSLMARPKLVGQDGPHVPLLVTRVE